MAAKKRKKKKEATESGCEHLKAFRDKVQASVVNDSIGSGRERALAALQKQRGTVGQHFNIETGRFCFSSLTQFINDNQLSLYPLLASRDAGQLSSLDWTSYSTEALIKVRRRESSIYI